MNGTKIENVKELFQKWKTAIVNLKNKMEILKIFIEISKNLTQSLKKD